MQIQERMKTVLGVMALGVMTFAASASLVYFSLSVKLPGAPTWVYVCTGLGLIILALLYTWIFLRVRERRRRERRWKAYVGASHVRHQG